MRTRSRRVGGTLRERSTIRVLLHLLELDPDARPSARVLAAALRCQGRRYDELSAALERLVADGSVDRAQRPGTTAVATAATRSRQADVYGRSPCGKPRIPKFPRTKNEAEARPTGNRDSGGGKGRTVRGRRS